MATMSLIDDDNLTAVQKRRIEKNRNKAIILKRTRLIPHPNNKDENIAYEKTTIEIGKTRYKDTGGGFLLEEEPKKDILSEEIVVPKGPVLKSQPNCDECNEKFGSSYLYDSFEQPVCDNCRDKEKYDLIAKTDALKQYLLKDCDLEKREPVLKFITRKNPHNTYGVMKLYLEIQVKNRAMEIWGSEQELLAEHDRREEKKIILKAKKYRNEMKKLRMSVRSSLYDKTSAASHKHAFGPEEYNEEEDNYTRICQTCGFNEVFEKM